MRVLVFGAEGQLGRAVCDAHPDATLVRADLDGPGHHVDLRDHAAVRTLVADAQPDFVYNCAAAHNVPRCESEPDEAFAVNATAVARLAQACRESGARLVHVSTDYVFGADRDTPYAESDLPAPLSVYGASKLAGEHLAAAYCPDHIICRTAALYGPATCRAKEGGRNFVSLMLHLAATRPELRVVCDEITTPTRTVDLARQMRILAERGAPGLYHTTCQGACSWHAFAQAIFEETGTDTRLVAVPASEFPSAVRRPAYSVLHNRFAQQQGLDAMPAWREALRAHLAETPAPGAG
jgi:dTDP-4-dehydrorhamnose reductase